MIVDITNEIYTLLKTELSPTTVLTSYPSTIPKFPCVMIEEISNTTKLETVDSSGENNNDVVLEFNIYDNSNDKTTQCKLLRNKIDTFISSRYCMSRTFGGVVPNYIDLSVYRYVLRYSFSIDENKKIYRR